MPRCKAYSISNLSRSQVRDRSTVVCAPIGRTWTSRCFVFGVTVTMFLGFIGFFFNAEGRGGWRRGTRRGLEVVDEAFDAVFEVGDVEVDEESEFTVG